MNPRKGLKRYGMRAYIVCGPRASIIIERERPWRYAIRHEGHPAGFFMEKFKRLKIARAVAEKYAGTM